MVDELEYQAQNTVFQSYILPDQTSTVTLSGGRTIPYTFYLGPNNTVPFVSLESPIASKEVTWGELVTIQPGQNVTVRNASYMPGDLQIQGGTLPGLIPPRITIPVEFTVTVSELLYTFICKPKFPCDTRRARRAWCALSVSRDFRNTVLQAWKAKKATIQPADPNYAAVMNGTILTTGADQHQLSPIETDYYADIVPTGTDPNPEISKTVNSPELYYGSCKGIVRSYLQQHSTVPFLNNTYNTPVFTHTYYQTDDTVMFPLGASLDGNAMRLADRAEITIQVTTPLWFRSAMITLVGGPFKSYAAPLLAVPYMCSYILEY